MAKRSKKDDTEFEMKFYEEILKRKPDFVQALMAVGDLYTKKGMYQKGLEIDERLAVIRPDEPIIQYNLACSYSLMNNIDRSFSAIKRAIECGYDDIPFLEEDTDLVNLRADNRFKAYFEEYKKGNDVRDKEKCE